MEKEIITKTIDLGDNSAYIEVRSENGTWEQEINSLIAYLELLKSKGATHITAYFGTTEWSYEKFDAAEIQGIYQEIESDEAFEKRVSEEKKRKDYYDAKAIEEKRQEYLRLKQIFEK